MTHHLELIGGFCTAGASTLALWLADSVPVGSPGALETGGTVGLIGGLSVALIAVWKDRAAIIEKLSKSEELRIAEAQAQTKIYREEMTAARASRDALLLELQQQTQAIKDQKS